MKRWFWMLLATMAGCSDYGLSPVMEELGLKEFYDCTTVVGERYWYEDHEFGVVLLYDRCTPNSYEAYLLVEHEYEEMDAAWTTATYTTQNGDVVTVDAVEYTLDFWYNPVDIEVTVVPFSGKTMLGLHEFWIDCYDDDSGSCPVDHVLSVTSENME